MAREDVSIKTKDGDCRAFVFTPEGAKKAAGKWPAVIFYMDGPGIRPTLFGQAQRLADLGYLVLLPDMFYRVGPYEPIDRTVVKTPEDLMKARGPMMASTNVQKAGEDTAGFLAYLDTRKDVAGKKVGTTGYCMGGGMSITAAGTYPDRIAAAAAFHPGGLATDAPISPHLQAPKIKGAVLIGGADKDNFYPREMHAKMEKALNDAGVRNHCEIYDGALHGWTMPDGAVYNEPAAERHWKQLEGFFAENLH
ncbi:MAG: dienelactone hydrolase family protein [Hyphomonadaceae bacterium]